MEKTALKCISTETFIHLSGPTYRIVENLESLIRLKIVNVDKIRLVTVKYNVNETNVQDGPVRIYCCDGVIIHLDLTAGYSGSGPSDLCNVLNLCSIDFDENDILSHQEEVSLRYQPRTEHSWYQFSNPDGTYEYVV